MSEMKIGGQVKMTYEILNSILCLPKGCKIVGVVDDQLRDIVNFKFHAKEKQKGIAYQVGEGMEYPTISVSNDDFAKRALKIVENIHEQAKDESRSGDWARKVLEEYQSEKELNE